MWAHDRTVDPDARDVHSLARERVNGVCSNTDDWYDLFGVKEGDKLFRKVDERVRIW